MALIIVTTHSEAETRAVGETIGHLLKQGGFACLSGELGAGKTTMAQGIAKGIGVPDSVPVSSPSFAIVNEYPAGGLTVFHMDAYRLTGEEDMLGAGFEDYAARGGVILLEWPERIPGLIPPDAVRIRLNRPDHGTAAGKADGKADGNTRVIVIGSEEADHADPRV